ncbi:MAG: toprim domain-containing protein [Faecousia sp.]
MIKLRQAIVVEGRYDKNTLSQLVDAPIFETNGFGVMKDREMLEFLRRVAQTRGLIILTDSDGAGFVIRNFLKGALPKDKVLHAYIPDIYGKERRKTHAGKEGKLGVEGMTPEILLSALRNAGAQTEQTDAPTERITKTDLFLAGLSGGAGSAEKRAKLQKELCLPAHLGANAFLDALNLLMSREEFLIRYGEHHD